ncbi:MAG: 3-dehydroquinate synthase [Spirochaetaceae bacterium]|nr:3-dehydroquinate synthase [Spirochaetaceae bacterium]
MNEQMTVTLSGGKTTKVSYLEDLTELSSMLGFYGNRALIVADSNTANLFKRMPPNNIILEPGESSKTLSSVEKILRTAVQEGLGRDDYIIGFGGGVVCDLAAFSASIYMRGCKLVLVPTSLLCMVDATIGGKAGFDFMGGKNLIGSFYPAEDVLICPATLKSLNEREYHNGLAEVLKHAVLSKDEILYKFLISRKSQILERDPKTLLSLLQLSLEVKKTYIEQDPEEKLGIRQALNLGHTFGHALESSGRFSKFSHGEGVAWGCACALDAGYYMGLTPKTYVEAAKKLFATYKYNIDYKIGRGDWLDFINFILKDKKKVNGIVQFVIMKGQGNYVLTPVPNDILMRVVLSNPNII